MRKKWVGVALVKLTLYDSWIRLGIYQLAHSCLRIDTSAIEHNFLYIDKVKLIA